MKVIFKNKGTVFSPDFEFLFFNLATNDIKKYKKFISFSGCAVIDIGEMFNITISTKLFYTHHEKSFFDGDCGNLAVRFVFGIGEIRNELQFISDFYEKFPKNIHRSGIAELDVIRILLSFDCLFASERIFNGIKILIHSPKKIFLVYHHLAKDLAVYDDKRKIICNNKNINLLSILHRSGELHHREKEKIKESIHSNREYLSFVLKILSRR